MDIFFHFVCLHYFNLRSSDLISTQLAMLLIDLSPLVRKIGQKASHLLKRKLQKTQCTQKDPSMWPLDNMSIS